MDNNLLSEGAKKYGVGVSNIYFLGGFSDNVFACRGRNFILKYYLSSIYEKNSIEMELDWILYLHQSDIRVTPPIPSLSGNLIETLSLKNGEECYVVAYEKAQGRLINPFDKSEWNPEFFYTWGKTLGKIHSLSRKYKPENVARKEWNHGLLFTQTNEISDGVKSKWNDYRNALEKLPRDNSSYGMIHHDLHHKNFFIFNNELVLFDFGDCEYNWFIYDIAVVLYHAVQTVDEKDQPKGKEFALPFLHQFLEGYQTENQIGTEWLGKLSFFLNYRQIYSYLYFLNYLNEQQKSDLIIQKKLEQMKIRIENDIPYIDLFF